jgi:hypothetical protein
MRFSKKALIATGTGAVAALAIGGLALAYWTTTGSGSGTGTTSAGTSDALTFNQDALTAMYPGDSAQPLTVKVTNTSGESAKVTTVKAYVTTASAGCTGADFRLAGVATAVDTASAVALTWTPTDLAANGFANATSTIQFNNTSSDQNACKSAAVTIHYLAS